MTSTASAVRLALASAVATLLAAAGLQPLIDDGAWAVPALVAVLLVAGISIGLRIMRVPAWAVLGTQGVVLLLWLGSLVASDAARLGFLPSRAWAAALVETYRLGIDTVAEYQAPVPMDDGILLLVVGGIGLTAWAVDALAVTARLVPLAGVPLVTMHAVAMATTPGGPTAWAFIATAVGYLGLLAVDGRERARAWGRTLGATSAQPASQRSRATSLSAIGIPMAIGALAVSVVGAAALPQGGLAIFDGTGGSGGSGGQTISTDNPIVDLRRDLVQPENVEVIRFTTTTSTPEYLRLLALDVYDGTVWRTADRPVPEANMVSGGLPTPPGLGSDVATREEQYSFEITERLQSQWLPLPYPVADVTPEDGDWRYYSETLDVVATDRDTRGLRYDATAVVVEPTADQLRGTPTAPGRAIDLLELPDNLPPVVRELAREVTADTDTAYERAVALQQWFREDGGFVYDLNVAPGNASDDLESFLDERRGYCEQYAMTMAIMARVLGIPARVAVGYLRGSQPQPGFWVVRAQDAHAWPELYFDGVGWVRFEPTPASRTGTAPAYTTGEDATTEAPDSLQNPVQPQNDGSVPGQVAPLDDELAQGSGASARPSGWPFVAALVALALLAATPLLAGVLTRRRRWASVGSDSRRAAEAAWADVSDAALEVGLSSQPHDTLRTAADALGSAADLPDEAQRSLVEVAQATERARFAPSPPSAQSLRDDAENVRRALVSTAPRATRWRALLWPAPARRLLRRARGG